MPAGAVVVIAASMPIRDVETFWPVLDAPPRALANRGANGIDGTISTAYGVAAADPARPTYLLIGDVALAHDVGGLLAGRASASPLTIVVVDNGGGGIFDFLPVATPGRRVRGARADAHRPGRRRVAALYGAAITGRSATSRRCAAVWTRRRRAPRSSTCAPSAPANVALHRRVWAAVAEALPASIHADR